MPGPPIWKPTSRAAERKDRNAAKKREQLTVYRQVDERDKRRCRACGAQADPNALDMVRRGHHHHVQFRSMGGKDEVANLCLLCPICHADVHAHRLAVSGNANEKLTFEKDGKTWTT